MSRGRAMHAERSSALETLVLRPLNSGVEDVENISDQLRTVTFSSKMSQISSFISLSCQK
jgi:hypothetical protein